MKKQLIIIVLFLAAGLFGQTKVGSTAAPFLNIGIGAKAVSMGGAYVATSNDVTSLYWNPAGASMSGQSGAYFSQTNWFADISFKWAGAMLNLDNLGTVGASITYLDYGKTEVTTLKEPEGTGEMFSAQDMVLAISYAHNLTDRFSIGANFKFINQSIWHSSASSFAVDLGVLFISDINGLRIGATISNFGTEMQLDGKDLLVLYDVNPNLYGNNDQIMAKLKTDSYPLPLSFKVGLAMDVINQPMHKVTLGIDALHPNDNAESVNVGGEYVFDKMIALRAGYKSLFLANTQEGLTLGFGLMYDISPTLGLHVDYAYQDFGVLKNTQFFSLGIKF